MELFHFLNYYKGVLGVNARNVEFLRPLNRKTSRFIADNKLLAKRVLKKAGIPVPETYAIVSSTKSLRSLDPLSLPKSFVLKPNLGLGGEGILITYTKKDEGFWLDTDLRKTSWKDIVAHVQDILDGRFSLAHMPDIAFFEERLQRDSIFKHLIYRGVPDVRVIVYNYVPIMAMLRLPTRESHGKANLHLGGIGVGVDIATGITTYAVLRDRLIKFSKYTGLKLPEWDTILCLSSDVQRITGLGYMGVDIVLTKNRGPVVLEVNARPGLSIQMANMAGLRERLMRVRGLEVNSLERSMQLVHSLFGKEGSGVGKVGFGIDMTLLHVVETVELFNPGFPDAKIEVKAKIDSGARSSSIDYELARELGYGDLVDFIKSFELERALTKQEARVLRKKVKKALSLRKEQHFVKVVHSASGSTVRVTIPLHFMLKGRRIKTKVNIISREHLTYDMIVGRRDLRDFLINPHIFTRKH